MAHHILRNGYWDVLLAVVYLKPHPVNTFESI